VVGTGACRRGPLMFFVCLQQTAPVTRAQERPEPVAQGLHSRDGSDKPKVAKVRVRQAVEDRAAHGGLQPDTVARARAEQAQPIARQCGHYCETPLTIIGARSQPIPMKNSTNSTHSSRSFIQALRGILLMLHSGGDAAPARSTPTSQSGAPSRAAAARGTRLPWPGAAPRGSAGERGGAR
jgi:hypothetical protein